MSYQYISKDKKKSKDDENIKKGSRLPVIQMQRTYPFIVHARVSDLNHLKLFIEEVFALIQGKQYFKATEKLYNTSGEFVNMGIYVIPSYCQVPEPINDRDYGRYMPQRNITSEERGIIKINIEELLPEFSLQEVLSQTPIMPKIVEHQQGSDHTGAVDLDALFAVLADEEEDEEEEEHLVDLSETSRKIREYYENYEGHEKIIRNYLLTALDRMNKYDEVDIIAAFRSHGIDYVELGFLDRHIDVRRPFEEWAQGCSAR